jgi:hypothetical protein
MSIELHWESPWPPLYGAPIIIPENTLLWRTYDTSYPAVGDRFAYYSSKQIAEGYSTDTRQLGLFTSSRPLRILDIRFMKTLLSRLIHTNISDKTINHFASIMISFGLCSLRHQIELIKMRYKKDELHIQKALKALEEYYKPSSIIEQVGVRVAETTNDTYTMGFLQELFKGVFDGFISPRMYSPFHMENTLMSPELILFNPKESGITQLASYSPKITLLSLNELIFQHNGHIVIENVKKDGINIDIKMDFFMHSGNKAHYLDEADTQLHSNKQLTQIYNDGCKAGGKWKKKVSMYSIETPTPRIPVSPFTQYELGI